MDQIEKVGRAWASFSSMTPRKGVSDPKCPLGTVLWRLHGSFARRWDQGSGAAARGRQPAVQAAWTWPGCPRRRSVPTSAVLASGRETASPTGVPYGPGGRSAGLGREEGPHRASLSRISKIPLKTKCDFYSLQRTFRNKWDWCPCHLIGTIVPSYRDRNPALPHPARYAHALAFRSGLYFTKTYNDKRLTADKVFPNKLVKDTLCAESKEQHLCTFSVAGVSPQTLSP